MMGDRCYLEVWCRLEALERMAELLGGGGEDDKVVVMEANYGLTSERADLARVGCVFEGRHGEGGGYGSYVFAAINGEMAEIQCNWEGLPIVEYPPGGFIDQHERQRGDRYWMFHRMVREFIESVELTDSEIAGESPIDRNRGEPKWTGPLSGS